MKVRLTILLGLIVSCLSPIQAHYLWVVIAENKDGGDVANIYFEESPSPGDGHYLDRFLGSSTTWVRTLSEPQPQPLQTDEIVVGDERWMRTKLDSDAERSIDAYGKFGVYAYGKKKVLLHYYARNLQTNTHDGIHELGRAERMRLDLVPHDDAGEVELKLLWEGQPAVQRMVFIRGPSGFRKNIKTDDRGRIAFAPDGSGRYTFRSSVELATPGEEDGEAYEAIRHNITLVMRLPVRQE